MSHIMTDTDILRVQVFTTCDAQMGINSYYYKGTQGATVGSPTIDNVGDSADALFSTLYLPLISDQAEYYGVGLSLRGGTVWLPALYYFASRAAGAATGSLLPKQTAGLIGRKVIGAGPHYKGRVYIPFPGSDSDAGNGRPTSGYQASLQLLADQVLTVAPITFGGGGNTWSVPCVHQCVLAGTTTYLTIDQALARTKWATQRRRGDYGRPNTPPF